MRRLAFTLIAWACLAGGAFAQSPAVTSLTFTTLTGRVVDGGNLLSPVDRAALTSDLAVEDRFVVSDAIAKDADRGERSRIITGQRWSRPLFFGLKRRAEAGAKPSP